MLLQAVSIISLLPRSVPVLGIIFYPEDFLDTISWRHPQFPSPYWGLFFIFALLLMLFVLSFLVCFRPRTGDYFFIEITYYQKKYEDTRNTFPSPYWGLFFYPYLL